MASVDAIPLRGIRYLTGIDSYSGSAVSALTEGAYSFVNLKDFADFNVRLKKMIWTCSQSTTIENYTLKVSGDPGYDPATPASYVSDRETVSFSYAFNFIVTDSSYRIAAGSNVTLTPAPFRQRDVGRSAKELVWEFNNHTEDSIRTNNLAPAGSWSFKEFDASGSTTSTTSGSIQGSVSQDPGMTVSFADANKWYINGKGGTVDGIMYESDGTEFSNVFYEMIVDKDSFMEGSSNNLPAITGATLLDLKIGTSVADPADENFPEGPAKKRFTGSQSGSVAFELYPL